MNPPKLHDSKNEVQHFHPCSSNFENEYINVLPVQVYTNALDSFHTSSTFTNASNCQLPLQSHTWASDTSAGVDPPLAGPNYWLPTPTHCISAPFTNPTDGSEPVLSTAWQENSGPLMQTDLRIQWWRDPWPASGSDDQTTLPSGIVKTGNSTVHEQKPESKSGSDATRERSQRKLRTDSPYPGPPRKKKSDGQASCQETGINSNASARTIDLASCSDSATTPMPLPPDVSFDSADKEAQENPRRSRSSATAGSTVRKRRARQSPTPTPSRSDQRARNRIAATKCRIKTKAAVAELEATEREESAKHERLSMTVRSLQADVFALKSEILLHGGCGDRIVQNYLNESARSLAAGSGSLHECGPGRVSSHSSSESSHPRR